MASPLPRFRPTPLQAALAVSVAAHAGLLALHVAGPGRPSEALPRDAPLEVVLINARTAERPPAVRVLAQASLDAGGSNRDKAAGPGSGGNRTISPSPDEPPKPATSPLPPAPLPRAGDADTDTAAAVATPQQVAELRAAQMQLLAQVRRELAALPAPEPQRDETEEQRNPSPELRAQEARRRELLDLLAAIEKRVNAHPDDGPRRRYIGPAASEVVYARYYERLRRRIEEVGTRDFPEYQGHKLYGELTMNLIVDAEGRVVETEIVRASSQRQLDRRAIAIVKAAAPFGPFTPAMRQQADELVVTSRFRFTHGDGLETTLAAPGPIPAPTSTSAPAR